MIPNLSTSYRGLDAAPNSTLQHAVSICTGQRDQSLPQLMAYSNGLSIALTKISPNLPTKALAFCGVIRSFSNYIGVSANGKDAIPNNDHGVHLKGGGGANVIG